MSRSRDFDSRPAKRQLGGELAQLFDLLDRGGVRARSRPGRMLRRLLRLPRPHA